MSTATALVEHTSEITPMGLLQIAVDQNVDPDRLRALMDLQERWERNQAEKEFAAAMHACQQEMPPVVMDGKNTQTNSRYATLENVQRVARPVYSKHGFSLAFGEADCTLEKHKRTNCEVRHAAGAMHSYHLDLPVDGFGAKGNPIGQMNPVQAAISTTSYGQRRLLCMIFNCTIAGEDDDGQASAKITDDQIAILNEWISLTETPLPRFLNAYALEKLSDMSASVFENAMYQLRRKAREKGLKV